MGHRFLCIFFVVASIICLTESSAIWPGHFHTSESKITPASDDCKPPTEQPATKAPVNTELPSQEPHVCKEPGPVSDVPNPNKDSNGGSQHKENEVDLNLLTNKQLLGWALSPFNYIISSSKKFCQRIYASVSSTFQTEVRSARKLIACTRIQHFEIFTTSTRQLLKCFRTPLQEISNEIRDVISSLNLDLNFTGMLLKDLFSCDVDNLRARANAIAPVIRAFRASLKNMLKLDLLPITFPSCLTAAIVLKPVRELFQIVRNISSCTCQ